MKTTIGLFNNYQDAQEAIRSLEDAGVDAEQISFIARKSTMDDDNAEFETDTTDDVSEGAGTGAVVGSVVGLIAGASAITIPGIGPVLTAGALATALGSTVVGAGLGGVVGALVDLGIPDDEAKEYADSIQNGQILVSVTGNDREIKKAQKVFASENAVEMQTDPVYSSV